MVEALPANESVPPQAEAPQSVQFTDSNLGFNASNPLPQVVIPPVVNGEANLAPQLDAQNLAAAQVWVTKPTISIWALFSMHCLTWFGEPKGYPDSRCLLHCH